MSKILPVKNKHILAKNLEIWSEDILIPTIDVLNSLDRLPDKELLDCLEELVCYRSENFCQKLIRKLNSIVW